MQFRMLNRQYAVMSDGCRIAWRFDGEEGRPVLVLSNSLGTRLEMWDPQIDAFTTRYRILRYDSRGHGASDSPEGAYSISRLGQDVVELLDYLGIHRATFCGLSKGGMVGQWLGYSASGRLERLILCNTSAYMPPRDGWNARMTAVNTGGMEAVADAVLDRWFTPKFLAQETSLVASARAMLVAANPQGYMGSCAAIRDMDQRSVLRRICVPTNVIAGDQDAASPLDHAKLLASSIEGAQLEILPAAHLSNIEQPSLFANMIMSI